MRRAPGQHQGDLLIHGGQLDGVGQPCPTTLEIATMRPDRSITSASAALTATIALPAGRQGLHHRSWGFGLEVAHRNRRCCQV